jgi:uncharacterized protein YbbC (DUF1343 family)
MISWGRSSAIGSSAAAALRPLGDGATVHPMRIRSFTLATLLAACAAQLTAQAPRHAVDPGITVLLRDSIHLIRGKRVGLITNHTGRDANGVSTIDLLARAPGVQLVALFGPEHGLRGLAQAGDSVPSAVDSATGVPIFSLYGQVNAPTADMLRNVDVLLYDIQDIGARMYTYVWTMALSAEAAGKRGIPFYVCDRPVPTRGDRVIGDTIHPSNRSFIGQYSVVASYGLTPGELLRFLVRSKQITANIGVIPMRGWKRSMWYDQTGLPWIAPSPNLRTVDAAALYPGTVLVEGTNLSEGRGTDAPFQLTGAPWLTDAGAIARELSAMPFAGVTIDSTSRTIAAGQKHAGLTIPMIRITVTDRDAVKPLELAMTMLTIIRRNHPTDMTFREAFMDRLAGTSRIRAAIASGSVARARALFPVLAGTAARFKAQTRPDLLY